MQQFNIDEIFEIAEQIVALYVECRIIAPFVRVTNLRLELGEFVQCLRLGGVRHPVKLLDALLISQDQVFDEG